MKVLELRCFFHRVVEVKFQRSTSQEAVGHLCQVDPDYGIRISIICNYWYQQGDVTKHEDIVVIFLTGVLMFLPQFRMVGMGQHLSSLFCVVLTEKSATEPNQPMSV